MAGTTESLLSLTWPGRKGLLLKTNTGSSQTQRERQGYDPKYLNTFFPCRLVPFPPAHQMNALTSPPDRIHKETDRVLHDTMGNERKHLLFLHWLFLVVFSVRTWASSRSTHSQQKGETSSLLTLISVTTNQQFQVPAFGSLPTPQNKH